MPLKSFLQRQQRTNESQNVASEAPKQAAPCTSKSCYQFYNSKTSPFFIESWPNVDFATGEFYGGSVAIDPANPSRTLFFIFKPATNKAVKEVTIWLNGGPGCSSMEGFLAENGPFVWQPGMPAPVQNDYAWSTETNMLWVDQPVGTGFSKGKITAKNEVDTAKDFVNFFKNWEQLFGIQNYKIYLTGESYAGRYIPYIGAEMLNQKNSTYLNLQGALMYDPCIGDCGTIQMVYPTPYFAQNNQAILTLDSGNMSALMSMGSKCGFNAFLDKYLQFPPPGPQPTVSDPSDSCDAFDYLNNLAETINPCYNIYHITDYCPQLVDELMGGTPYFNRKDVKKAIHAPANFQWNECGGLFAPSVFLDGVDRSPDSRVAVLPQVIEATNRVLVSNADWDALVTTNGTLLTIQNMTWNGNLGFRSAPTQDFVVPGQGILGKMHFERGLQWVETYQAGHMQPQYQPRAALRHLQWLLGRIPNL